MMRGDLPALTETGRDGGPQQRARSHGAFARRRLVAWRESIDPTFLYRCAGGILLTLGVTGVGTPATTTAQSSQLIAAYAFDEGSGTVTADASGNGHVGTLLNGPTWTTGKYGGALSFNGLSSAVSAGNPASLNNVNTFTYCAWVFPRSRGGQNDARILHKGTPTARKQLQTDSSLTNSLKLRVDRATASAEALSVANTMSLNQWQFVCGTYSEADGARVYKNGVEVTYTSRTVGSGATVDDSAATLYIGNRGDLARGWDGLIDEVRVYGGILTPAEIQTAMTTPLGGGSSDTIPPTAPATLTATAGGPGQIDLAWTAATDNVGVTAYLVERCQGSPCSFAQVATVAGLAYSDTGLAAATSYSYQVRATDAAGNLGPYSPVASATTKAQSSQLIAAYAFDEGSGTVTADASGNGHVGTLLNGPTWTTGKYGGALSFNGLSSAVSAGNPASLNNVNTFTYCAWVFPRSRGGQNDARILHKGTPTARKQLQTDSSLTNSLKL
ncbi:MAG: hypothetical protein DME06_05600, partial [Candidatus Rokuibacteriota bacterium]